MKKYIFIALAAAGTMACSKLTPVDSIPVTELPEDETTETVAPKEGETITIQLAQTKVTLDKTVYVFEGNEQIVVKAASGPVATLSNSTKNPNTFTGVFETPLDTENPSFDFYYNCTDASGNPNYEQNGQPWLEHKGVTATRATDGGYAYYVVEGVQLRQPEGYVALAITSDDYDCTVSFNTLQKDPQTVGKTIEGIAVSAGKPYFVNVSKEDLTEGFYLAVNKKGETGTMYTSYGTTAPISSNKIIKIKKEFEAFSISGQLVDDESRTFQSTYNVYRNSGADAANGIDSDIISSGEATFTMTGISKTIRNLVSLKNITVKFSDDISASVKATPAWTETKSCTITIPQTKGHNTWGPVTVPYAVAVFSTPDGNDYEVSFANPSMTRHITGLPYRVNPPSNSGTNKWTAKNSNLVSTVNWKTTYVHLEGISKAPEIVSPSFHIPDNLPFSAIFDILIHSRKPTFSWGSWMYPTFTAATKVGTILTQEPKAETEDCTYKDITGNATFTTSANTISLKSSQATTSPYIRVSRVDVIYRDE